MVTRKFNVGDAVLPTNRAPRDMAKSFKNTPRKVKYVYTTWMYNRERTMYDVGALGSFLAEELKPAKVTKK